MIFSQNAKIQKSFEKYEKTKNSEKFLKELKTIIDDQVDEEDSDEEDLKVSNEVLNNVESSPNDYLMYMKKRRNQHVPKKRSDDENVAGTDLFGSSVKACEEGMSPKINFRDYEDSD